MKGTLLDLTTGLDGKQRITIQVEGDLRETWDALHGGEIELEIKRWRKKRTIDSNAYCWILIDKLAAALKLTRTEIYRAAIREIGGVSETVCVPNRAVDKLIEGWTRQGVGWQAQTMKSKISGCTNVILYFGSSTYDREQMAQLIDVLVMECKAQGIETMSPNELRSMEDAWGGKER